MLLRHKPPLAWMIAGGSVEILKNRIAAEIFDRRFDQQGKRADAAE